MTARCHIDDCKLVRNLLFCKCDEDPTRKSRERMIVQLEAHSRTSSKISVRYDSAAHNRPSEKECPAQDVSTNVARVPREGADRGTRAPLNRSVCATGPNYCRTSDHSRWKNCVI